MTGNRPLLAFAPLLLAALLLGCTQKNTGDEAAATTGVPTGLERFLLFPNPIAQNTGGFETNTTAYADAYYRAIDTDPANPKDTLEKWKTANGFGGGTGTEHLAVFRDTKDLGYGRRMTGRMNADGSVAFFVENYSVQPNAGGDYSSTLNVEAAIRRDAQWHVGTNAIEWSTAPCVAGVDPADCSSTVKFAKFYNFSSADGTRQLSVDLDGKGMKAMPGPCITCHGGRGDPLTPADVGTGKQRFPLVENSPSRKRGDVQGRLHGMNVGSFGYSAQAGFTRADQEAKLKTFNQWILCTYPLAGAAAGAEDTCRVPAGANEWQGTGPGTASDVIKAWYGGNGMAMTTFSDNPPYVPSGWNGNPTLYTDVVAPFCRTCHIVRGTANQSDIDFTTLAKFQGYADRIKAHVFDRGTMPLALIVYDDFWNSGAPTQLANFINPSLATLAPPQTATNSSGAALRPGRPIANPGPDRMVRTSVAAILTGENSLFASSWRWDLISGSGTINQPDAMITSFTASSTGIATVRLTVGNGSASDSKLITITPDNTFPDPSTLRFAQVKDVLENVVHKASVKCVACHVTPLVTPTPPILYNVFDRDGSGGAADTTDDAWFLKALGGRVNLTEIDASPLLRKPSGNHHSGNDPLDLNTAAGLRNYSILYHWILGGMLPGGLIANAGADSTGNLIFAGTPAGSTVALDGSASVGAATYAWSIVSATPAVHPNGTGAASTPASITQPDPALPGATLHLFDIGTYVVRLTISNGTDPAQSDDRTITVTETVATAVASPSGTQTLTFAGSPSATATLNLTSATTGSPLSFSWIYFPSGLTTGPCGTINSPTSANSTVTVPSSAINTTCSFRVFASNVSTTGVGTTTITIAAAAGQSPGNLNFTFPASSIGFTIGNSLANGTTTLINSVATNTITLTGSATGLAPLNFTWSLLSGTGTAGCSFLSPGPSTSTTVALTVAKAGTCSVTMTVSNAIPPSASTTKTVTVTSSVVFSTVASILTSAGCTGCHNTGGPQTPSWVNDAGLFGRLTGTAGVVNTTNPRVNSLLLVCPSAGCSAVNTLTNMTQAMGGNQSGFGTGGFGNYDSVLTWITNGATNP